MVRLLMKCSLPHSLSFLSVWGEKKKIKKREREREREREHIYHENKATKQVCRPCKSKESKGSPCISKEWPEWYANLKKKRKRENPFLSPKALLIILFTSISILSVFEKIYEVKDLKITLWWIRKNTLRPFFFFFLRVNKYHLKSENRDTTLVWGSIQRKSQKLKVYYLNSFDPGTLKKL